MLPSAYVCRIAFQSFKDGCLPFQPVDEEFECMIREKSALTCLLACSLSCLFSKLKDPCNFGVFLSLLQHLTASLVASSVLVLTINLNVML